jgi:hypothetical protein
LPRVRPRAQIDDRIRFAWPFGGGAVRVGLAGLAPPILLLAAALTARLSFAALGFACVALPLAAAWGHRRLGRLRSGAGFLLSWTLHSYALCSVHFVYASTPRASELANVATGALGLAGALALGGAHAPPSVLSADADADARRAARAHRCSVSGLVVARYDHYCGWVGAPVGAGNHRAYLAFVAATAAAAAANGLHCARGALGTCAAAGGGGSPGACARWHAANARGSLDVFLAAMMAATSLAVGCLLINQCMLIGRNLTTYEARHWARIDYLQPRQSTGGAAAESGARRSPFDRGFRANWAEFLAGSSGGQPAVGPQQRPSPPPRSGVAAVAKPSSPG